MAAEDGVYLPPVVIEFTGDAEKFLATLEEVKGYLADFAKTVTDTKLGASDTILIGDLAGAKALLDQYAADISDAHLGGSDTLLIDDIAAAKALLLDFATQVSDAKLGADADLFWAEIARLRAEIDALAPMDVDLGANLVYFEAKIAELRAMLAAIPPVDVPIGGNDDLLLAKLAQARIALGSFANDVATSKVTADTAPFWERILALKTLLEADPATLDVNADIKPALAEIAALRGALALSSIGTLTFPTAPIVAAAAAAGGSGGKAFQDALYGAMWGGGGGSFIQRLLSPITALGTIFSARFGTIGSLAGFGLEHAVLTAVGLIGSLAGAALGGLALALGAAGVAAVGFGTDLAGIGQASGDIKTVSTDMTALNAAIAQYGQGSTQAISAQQTLNTALNSFNPIARQAVQNTANLIQGFKSMFDQVTGLAEKRGAEIIGSLVTLGDKFLPTIGKFAAENMAIIQKALAPLLSWLGSGTGGFGIFTELEQIFQRNLPTAMHAFDQGVELLIKTIGFVAPYTGKFIADLNKLFTRLNSPEGFAKFTGEITKMIGLFHTWMAFLDILVKDIVDIFSRSAGLGKGIVQELTGYLQELHKALNSTGGDKLSELFKVHKAEILELIAVLVHLGDAFTQMYLIAAPFLVQIATLILRVVDALITFVSKLPGGADLLGLGIILARMGLLRTLIFGAGKDAGVLATGLSALRGPLASVITGIASVLAGWAAAAARFVALWTRAVSAVVGEMLLGAEESRAAWLTTTVGALKFLGIVGLISAAVLELGHYLGNLTVNQPNLKAFGTMQDDLAGLLKTGSATQIQAMIDRLQKLETVAKGFGGIPGVPNALPTITHDIAELTARYGDLTSAASAASDKNHSLADALKLADGASVQAKAHAKDLADQYQALNQASDNIGTSIASQATGFATFSTAATESVNKLIGNLEKQNATLAGWAKDAQILIARGMNPQAVAALAKEAPQDLATLVTASHAQLVKLNAQWSEQMTLLGTLGKNGVAKFTSNIIDGLVSANPATRAAAQRLAESLKITTPNTRGEIEAYLHAILSGLESGNPSVRGAAEKLAQNLHIDTATLGKGNADRYTAAIQTALNSGNPKVRAAAQALASDLHLNLEPEGAAAGSGFAQGLLSSVGQVTAAAQALAAAPAAVISNWMKIRSPSLVMAAIGVQAGAGLAQGLSQSTGSVIAAAKALAQAALSAFGSLKGLAADQSALAGLRTISEDLVGLLGTLAKLPAAFEKISGSIRNVPGQFQALIPTIESLVREFGTLLRAVGDTAALAKLGGPLVTTLGDLAGVARNLTAIANAFTALKSSISFLPSIPGLIDRITPSVEAMVRQFRGLLEHVGNTAPYAKLGTALDATLGTLLAMARDLLALATAFTALRAAVPELNRIPDQLRRLAPAIRETVTEFERLLTVVGNTAKFATLGRDLDGTLGTLVTMARDLIGLATAFDTLRTKITFVDRIPALLRAVMPAVRELVQDFGRLLKTIGDTANLAKLGAPLDATLGTLVTMANDLNLLAKAFTTLETATREIDRIPARLRAISPAVRELVSDFGHLLGTVGPTANLAKLGSELGATLGTLVTMATDINALATAFEKLKGSVGFINQIPGLLRRISPAIREVVSDFGHLLGTIGNTSKLSTLGSALSGTLGALVNMTTDIDNLVVAFKAIPGALTSIDRIPAQLRAISPAIRQIVQDFARLLGTIGNTSKLATLGAPLGATLGTIVTMATDLENLAKAFTALGSSVGSIDKIPGELRAITPAVRGIVSALEALLASLGNTKGVVVLGTTLDNILAVLIAFANNLRNVGTAFAGFKATLTGLGGIAGDLASLGVLTTIFAALKAELKDIGSTTGVAAGLAAIAGVLNNLRAVFVNATLAGKDAAAVLPAGVTAIVNALSSLNSRVLAYLKTTTPMWKGMGASWVTSLLAGMQSVNLIPPMRVVTNALLAFLRSLTPLFKTIGEQWMAALVAGIKAGSKNVNAALVIPKTAAITAAATAASGSSSVVVHQGNISIYAPTGNANDISRTLLKALKQQENDLIAKLQAGSAGHLVSG